MQVILYPYGSGVAVVVPSPDCGLTVHQIAEKDVPAGAPYRVVDASTLPSDLSTLTADFSNPDGFGGNT